MFTIITPTIRPHRLGITYESLKRQTNKDFEWLIEVDFSSSGFLLPKALNNALRRAKYDTIVMLQDCTEIPDNFLEHISKTFKGDFVTYPVGKRNGDTIDWDWRKERSGEIQPQEWEADLAIAPKKAFFDIGGYDETYCDGWSWDNVEVAYRAEKAGYKFSCDNSIQGIAIDHDKEEKHPFRGVLKNNDWRARVTKQLADQGQYVLHYL